jgi:hypothetical protein
MSAPRVAVLVVAAAMATGGCAESVSGTPTWPGARIEQAVLSADDFPPGVIYDRVNTDPAATSEGSGGPPAMLSRPQGCSDGLTRVISASAERGAGSAAEYVVGYDGARIVMTVLSWPLDLDGLAAEAERCARFETFFDTASPGIPMTTTRLDIAGGQTLAYQQTMTLGSGESSVYFWFANVEASAVFGVAFPTSNPTIAVKAALPQTFLDVAAKQTDRLGVR